MKPIHIPRILFALVLALVILVFLTGALRAFYPAHAAIQTTAILGNHMSAGLSSNTPTMVPAAIPVSADTTGIMALTIVVVVIVLVGAAWGRWKAYRNGPPKD